MLDPRPREQMNQMVMDAMTHTSKRYWIVTALFGLAAGACCLFGDVGHT